MHSKHEGYDSVRSKIIATAAGLFTQTGVHGTSLNDIAKASELAKGTVYYYYPTKEGLVLDVANSHFSYWGEIILSWVEQLARDEDPVVSIELLVEELLKNEYERRLHAVLMAEGCLFSTELTDFISESERKWALMFEVGVLKLRMPDSRNLRKRTDMFFTLLDGYMLKSDIAPDDIHKFIDMLIN